MFTRAALSARGDAIHRPHCSTFATLDHTAVQTELERVEQRVLVRAWAWMRVTNSANTIHAGAYCAASV